jgi:hypothetical protein
MFPVPTPAATLVVAQIKEASAVPSASPVCISALIFMDCFLPDMKNLTPGLYRLMNVSNARTANSTACVHAPL